MARDTQGSFSLAAGNPVTAGTSITATWANGTLSDIANEITNSLDRNGRGGMLAPFKFADGTLGAPALAFTNETGTGIYRAGTNDMRVVVGGTAIAKATGTALAALEDMAVAGDLVVTGNTTMTGTLGVTGGITKASLPAVGQQVSSSCGAFNFTGGSLVDVTNLTVTITTTGRPVMLALVHDGSANALEYKTTTTQTAAQLILKRGSTTIQNHSVALLSSGPLPLPPVTIDVVGAGTYTYKYQGTVGAVGNAALNYAKLIAYEL